MYILNYLIANHIPSGA